jgi:hypothetical protein
MGTNKTFRKQCYLEIRQKKKKIIVEMFLVDHYCDAPAQRWIFHKDDIFTLKNIYADLTIQDYENRYC